MSPVDVIDDPVEFLNLYYPSFKDGDQINKFIIPILPVYHDKLFFNWHKRDGTLFDKIPTSVGNTIKKAYLCHSKSKKAQVGDLIFFYRSQDIQSITALGIVEKIYYNQSNIDEIIKIVGKRTVYTYNDLQEIAAKNTTIYIFKHLFYLEKQINLDFLLNNNILKGVPQSVTQISQKGYLLIKKAGEINESYSFN